MGEGHDSDRACVETAQVKQLPEKDPDAVPKGMYSTGDDSDSDSDSTNSSSLKVQRGGLRCHQEPSSEEEVELCSCDVQQLPPICAANGYSPSHQTRSQRTHLDQSSSSSSTPLTNRQPPVTQGSLVSAPGGLGQSSSQSRPVSFIDTDCEPCDEVKASVSSKCGGLSVYRGPSSTESLSDSFPASESLKLVPALAPHPAAVKLEISGISSSDTRLSASTEKVLESRTNALLKKNSELTLFETSDCPVRSNDLKPQTDTKGKPSTPKLKGLSIKSRKHEANRTANPLNTKPVKAAGTAAVPNLSRTSTQPESSPAPPKVADSKTAVGERRPPDGPLQTTQSAKDRDLQSKSRETFKSQERCHQPVTQRTFIEVHLSGASSNRDSSPSKDFVTADCTAEKTNGMVANSVQGTFCFSQETPSNPATSSRHSPAVDTNQRLKSGVSRFYMKSMEKQSFPPETDKYNPFSVRHKIKSFENLAHFDKPVSRSSDIQSYALAYRASLGQRIAGYMDVVNSADCQNRHRTFNPYSENFISTTPQLGKSPSTIALINLELPDAGCKTTPLLAAEDQKAPSGTPQVLRRKHGKLARSRLRQLRALSMPELEKICTEDFTRGLSEEKPDPRTHPTVQATSAGTECSPPPPISRLDDRLSEAAGGSTKTRGPEASWSIW